jgi:ribosome-associated protein
MKKISVRADIKLDQLLKYTGFVSTGGEAKLAIQNGIVTINGNTETRRGYKVKDGDIVEMNSILIRIYLQK